MTRAEAIDWLRSVGLNASARDWAMGETIVITIGEPEMAGDIKVYPSGAVYVCPEAGQRWTLLDCYFQNSRSRVPDFDIRQRYSDLASATKAAREYVEHVEADPLPGHAVQVTIPRAADARQR